MIKRFLKSIEELRDLFYDILNSSAIKLVKLTFNRKEVNVKKGNYPPLSPMQSAVMTEFYSFPNTEVVVRKKARQEIWKKFAKDNNFLPENLQEKCPALLAELKKSLAQNKRVQPAVFSECSYAQTIANMLGLSLFVNCGETAHGLSQSVVSRMDMYHLTPRYVYKSVDGKRALIQAGGPAGVDSVLISASGVDFYNIEFKEPAAKTTEADLPVYGENGCFIATEEFLNKHSQYDQMLKEQIERHLNIWNVTGLNVHDFGDEAIAAAVSNNYTKDKLADVICVEDQNGFLTMIPANQAGRWAITRGEIRSTGRNSREVWTPIKLKEILIHLGGMVQDEVVTLPLASLDTSKRRGGNDDVGRYRIKSIFFVREEDISVQGEMVKFKLESVRQSKPTISAHMFFKLLNIDEVREHYGLVN